MMETNIENKGFTLIELVVSIAIMAIVITAVTYFMSRSTKNYQYASDDISLQTEAQTMMNQLCDIIMEANNVKFDPSLNLLKIYQTNIIYVITFDTSNHKLMFKKTLHDGTNLTTDQIFGEYVESFIVTDTGLANSNKEIGVSIGLKKGVKEYHFHNIVTLRNRIQPVP